MNALAPYVLFGIAILVGGGNWLFLRYRGERIERTTSLGLSAFSYVLAAVCFFAGVSLLTGNEPIYVPPQATIRR